MSAGTEAAGTTRGTAGRWIVDPAASAVRFKVRDKLVSTVHGSMPVLAGEVVVDASGAVEEAWVRVDPTGISTGNARRDGHLQGPGFLDTGHHPDVVVRVGPCTPGPQGVDVDAVVSARGTDAPASLSVRATARPSPDQPAQLVVSGRLDRAPLGIRAPALLVGRWIHLEADLTVNPSGR